MGVTGLWQLLGPVGHPVPLETLENKVLAVDVSIWLNQALKGFRDAQGQSLQNAHLLGIFHRVCKLLFYKIKPVFVFDGVAPLLKRQTLAARQERKHKATDESRDTTKKILVNLLNQNLVQQEVTPGTSSTSRRKPAGSRSAESDLFKLPPLPEGSSLSSSEEEDAALGSNFWQEEYQNPSQIDVDSEDFLSLPADLRHEILMNMKERRKRNWEHISKMPDRSEDFSNYQMMKLLGRRKLQQKIEDVRKEMSTRRAEEFLVDMYEEPQCAEVKRISSDDSSHYVLITGLKNGALRPPADGAADAQTSKTIAKDDGVRQSGKEAITPEEIDLAEEPIVTISRSNLLECQEISEAWSKSSANVTNLKETMGLVSPDEKQTGLSKQEFNPVFERKGNVEMPDEGFSQIRKLDVCEMVDLTESKKNIETVDLTSESKQKTEMVDLTESKKNLETVDLTSESKHKTEMVDLTKSKQTFKTVDLTKSEEKLETVATMGSPQKPDENLECENVQLKVNELEKPRPLDGTLSQSREPVKTLPPMAEMPTCTREENPAENEIVSHSPVIIPSKSVENQDKAASHIQVTVDTSSAVHDNLFPADVFLADTLSPEEMEDDQNDLHLIDVVKYRDQDRDQLLELDSNLREEEQRLLQERGKLERQAATVTDQMYQEAQELLKFFGIPFVVSPAEAEAQCAQLELLGLTQGTITDDSDIWLFGGSVVYKNFFTQGKYIEKFSRNDITSEFGLTRDRMICFAMLTGSDYTEGILNVGHVTAMEILSEFPGEGMEILKEFRDWWDSVREHERPGGNKTLTKFRKLFLSPGFPSSIIYDAYLNPEVDPSEERFTWGLPDLQTIRDFGRERFGWSRQKIDGMMLPVMKKVAERQSQLRLDGFLKIGLKKERNLFPSKRLQKAVKKIQSPEKVAKTPNLSESSSSEDDPQPETLPKVTPKGSRGARKLSEDISDDPDDPPPEKSPKVNRRRIRGAKKPTRRT